MGLEGVSVIVHSAYGVKAAGEKGGVANKRVTRKPYAVAERNIEREQKRAEEPESAKVTKE